MAIDENAIKVDLFGDVGADRFGDALDAVHLFAQATNCPAGADVIKWFDHQMQRFQATAREAHNAFTAQRAKEAGHGG